MPTQISDTIGADQAMALLLAVAERHIGNILDAIQASATLIFLIGRPPASGAQDGAVV
jgi:hypothetical protein